ncbi:MAG: TetR/AcrR family transcriptional regulator [Clostridiales bacterium]|nr:TetR/AcrR family transcriptional regulator [Clostridiales bacterium]
MNKRPEITERTKAQICAAFWKLNEINPINKVYVSEIIKIAGVNRATFYRYYHDVYAIREEKEKEIIAYFNKRLGECLSDMSHYNMQEMMREICSFYQKEAFYLRILSGPNGDTLFLYSLKKELMETMIKKLPMVHLTLEQKLQIDFLRGGIMELLNEWLIDIEHMSIETICEISLNMIKASAGAILLNNMEDNLTS